MQFLFTAPIARASVDGGATISGIKILSALIDPDALTCTVMVQAIEDLGPERMHKVVVTGLTGATTMSQLIAAVKAQVATALAVPRNQARRTSPRACSARTRGRIARRSRQTMGQTLHADAHRRRAKPTYSARSSSPSLATRNERGITRVMKCELCGTEITKDPDRRREWELVGLAVAHTTERCRDTLRAQLAAERERREAAERLLADAEIVRKTLRSELEDAQVLLAARVRIAEAKESQLAAAEAVVKESAEAEKIEGDYGPARGYLDTCTVECAARESDYDCSLSRCACACHRTYRANLELAALRGGKE